MSRWIGPYEILLKLGEGGMGAVYKARDSRLERPIALKTLPARFLTDPSRRRRFVREAQSASALNHPNIITIYEIAQWEGSDYIAMEYVEGQTLRSLLETRPRVQRLLPVMRQLAEALTVAHAAGIVHRDIKPENVMVRSDGYVKVLDFGVARLVREEVDGEGETATRPGTLIGTMRYMSPEQARGEPTEGPSDVFSLGLVFYELATGGHPFHAATPQATIAGILSQAPTPPSRLNPELPAPLEDLVLRMLEKDAWLRPAAADVRATLARLEGAEAVLTAAAPTPARRSSVGRERERREVEDAFEAASKGAWTLLCVTGEPGIGKTTLVEEFLDGLRARGKPAWIGRGRCSERLAGSDALLPVLEGLESLLRGPSGDQAARLLNRFAPTWYRHAAPSLGEITGREPTERAEAASQERMKRELHAFFEELCRVRPFVLFLDDMHWSDVSTCDLLSYLSAKGRDLPALVVATYRPVELLAAKHAFQPLKLQLQSRGACREVALEFLGREDVERLLALRFPDHRFQGELAQLIHAKTDGNPLFVADMLRYLRDRGALAQREGAWVLTRPTSELERELPDSMRSMIQVEIDRLSEHDHKLLLAASVQGVEFDSAVLAKALAREPVEVEERLQELETGSPLTHVAGEHELPDRTVTLRCRFIHAFYQDALYRSLVPSRRAALSAAVAQAIVSFGGDKVPAQAARLGFLFESAREFPSAGLFFLRASRHAARIFAYPEAASLAGRGLGAVEAVPDSEERAKLELPLSIALGISLMATKGYAHPDVGRTHERARQLCLRLGDQRRLAWVLMALWSFYVNGARLKEALEVAHAIRSRGEASPDPAVRLQSLQAVGATLLWMGRFAEARGLLERSLEGSDPRHQPSYPTGVVDPSVFCLVVLSRLLALTGHLDQALTRAREAVERAQGLAHSHSLAYAMFFLSYVHQGRGEAAAARQQAEVAMALSRELGLLQILEWGHVVHGWALIAQGTVAEGVAELRKSLNAQQEFHSQIERPYWLTVLAQGLSRQGEHDEALAKTAEALAIVESSEERGYEPEIHRTRGEVLLARAGRADAERAAEGYAGARASFERALELARASGARSLELHAAKSLFRLGQALDDVGPARGVLAEVVAGFAEGAETPYLAQAREMLAPPAAGP